ncbi:MAG TPA: aminodeoxychorismate synthase component I [Anaerolineales bacterium]|nr:aminodeoxychorismate synthase component I [Anaerolineales bacterium]
MIKINEVILKKGDDWLCFSEPHRVMIAERHQDVLPAMREMEHLVNMNGWHAAGFVSYEAAPAFDKAFRPPVKASGLRERSSEAAQTKGGFASIDNLGNRAPSSLHSHRSDALSEAREDFPYLWFGLYPPPRLVTLPEPDSAKPALTWSPTVDRDTYNAAIEQIKDHIADGWTYQVNYTMRLLAEFHIDAWNFFLHLAQSQNNHAAYLDAGRYVICSASPELFFQLDGETITSRPMKGTTHRGRTTLEDRDQAQWLHGSEKNRAENVMIVDMIRNDLGRIARIGSVQVPELFTVEKYPTLWQMTSTVTAKTNASLTEIFAALFPCASITGAPKVSTMRIISELETSPRRIYTGSIGYIAPGRKAKFNVAIRTALIDRETQKAEYGVGGGIVWDSTSTDEYAEALLKARVLTDDVPHFSLLETMLWTPEEGFFLREKHVARLLDSADYFDFPISYKQRWPSGPGRSSRDVHLHRTKVQVSRPSLSKEIIEEYLHQISTQFNSPQRVRLLLDKFGNLSSETKSIQPPALEPPASAADIPLKVCLAKEPIHSENVLLYHKTTHRDMYIKALRSVGSETPQEHSDYDDVLLYNERNELTEFTIGNLVVEMDGKLFTPALSCGLLPGTHRAHLLETGQVEERIIRVEELKNCTKIFLVNSVRKWQEVKIMNG